jgi:hypothetical protein
MLEYGRVVAARKAFSESKTEAAGPVRARLPRQPRHSSGAGFGGAPVDAHPGVTRRA